jgi:hypothetical protein
MEPTIKLTVRFIIISQLSTKVCLFFDWVLLLLLLDTQCVHLITPPCPPLPFPYLSIFTSAFYDAARLQAD